MHGPPQDAGHIPLIIFPTLCLIFRSRLKKIGEPIENSSISFEFLQIICHVTHANMQNSSLGCVSRLCSSLNFKLNIYVLVKNIVLDDEIPYTNPQEIGCK